MSHVTMSPHPQVPGKEDVSQSEVSMRPSWPIRGQGWPPLPQVLEDGVGILEDFQHFWVLMRDKYVTIPQLPSPAVWGLSKIHVFSFWRIIFCPAHKVEFRVILKICQFKWDYDKVEIQMFWSLQVTRDALCRCKKCLCFSRKTCLQGQTDELKKCPVHQILLTLISLS